MPLYEVAILEHPTKKESEEGMTEKLIFGPKAVVAKDPQSAALGAVLADEIKIKIDMGRSEVLVRPFGGG